MSSVGAEGEVMRVLRDEGWRGPMTIERDTTCYGCGAVLASPRARASHERSHPQLVIPAAVVAARAEARLRSAGRAYEARHSEARNARNAEYRKAHAEQIAARKRAYRETQADAIREYGRAYRASAAGRAAQRRQYLKEKLNGKRHARLNAQYAVKTGRLVPSPCQECGEPRVQAHHYLGYEREHQLDVLWLCRKHHAAAHTAKALDDTADRMEAGPMTLGLVA